MSDVDLSDDQIDSLLEGGEESRDIPMREEAPAVPWTEDTIKVDGKEIKAPREQILTWAQQGRNYSQLMGNFNKEKTTLEQQLNSYKSQESKWKEIEQKWSPYKEVDEYAAKNPDWWNQVQEAYKQKIAGAESNPEIAALKNELADLKKFKDELTSEKMSVKMQEEDSKLSQEVESIRKSFPTIDFDTPDENGKSLEMRVLEHADQNGINSFRVAFRDFYHESLISKAKEEGKEVASKEVQKRTKLGILGETSKPTRGIQSAKNVKDQSYESLMQEALEELRSGKTA